MYLEQAKEVAIIYSLVIGFIAVTYISAVMGGM